MVQSITVDIIIGLPRLNRLRGISLLAKNIRHKMTARTSARIPAEKWRI